RCGSFVFSPVQGNEPPWKYQIDAMWAGMDAAVPTLNGYSANQPPGWRLGDTSLYSDVPDPTVAGAIDDWITRNGLDPARVRWLRLAVRNDGYWASSRSRSRDRWWPEAPQDTDRWGTNRAKPQRAPSVAPRSRSSPSRSRHRPIRASTRSSGG